MLCIKRNAGQTVVISECVTVKVGEVIGNAVKLVIEAPRSVRVRRGEVPPDEPMAVHVLRVAVA